MSRLTDRCWKNLDPWECCGQNFHCSRKLNDDGGCINGCIVPKLYKHLAEYEDLEEQGLLLKLPCKAGDTVYSITRDFISEYNIRNFICYDNGNIFFDWKCVKGIYLNIKGFHIDDIGKTVFLTKEEAEKALERLEKDNELY